MSRSVYTLIFASALVVGACASPPAPRQNPSGDPRAAAFPAEQLGAIARPSALVLVSFDADRDGVVHSEDVAPGAQALFAMSDLDGDGDLRGVELQAFSERHLGAAYAVPGRFAFDPDGDGQIPLDAFIDGWMQVFNQADSNRDGQVVRAELVRQIDRAALQNQFRGQRRGQGRSAGRGRGGTPG